MVGPNSRSSKAACLDRDGPARTNTSVKATRTRIDRAAPRRDGARRGRQHHVRSDRPQAWGDPDVDDDLKLFGNFGYALPGEVEPYSHTSYSTRRVSYGIFVRNPNTRLGVFSSDRGRTLLVGDVLAASGGLGQLPDGRRQRPPPDPVALAQAADGPSCFTFQELFPGGFTPRSGERRPRRRSSAAFATARPGASTGT